MIDVLRIRELLVEAKDSIPQIKSVLLVVDESQIVEKMKKFTTDDNLLLMGVIPEYDYSQTKDIDNQKSSTHIAFLVLEKVNYRGFTEEVEINVWQRTLIAVNGLKSFLIGNVEEGCQDLQGLDIASIRVEPVWKLAECNGWILTCTIEN